MKKRSVIAAIALEGTPVNLDPNKPGAADLQPLVEEPLCHAAFSRFIRGLLEQILSHLDDETDLQLKDYHILAESLTQSEKERINVLERSCIFLFQGEPQKLARLEQYCANIRTRYLRKLTILEVLTRENT